MRLAPLTLRAVASLVLCGLALSGCSDATTASQAPEPTPQKVSVVTVQPSPLPLIRELPGRIAPTRIAEVRARVTGIVVSRNFEQGSDVELGDVLYRLDSEPFEIELKATEAALAKAEAVLKQATQNAHRMETLAPSRAVAQSQVDIAVAELNQAKADVDARKADVARARVNLDHTVIRAPISGRIGRALVTEGALVGQSNFTHVATIQKLDPIYADFTQSVAELNQLRRDFASGELDRVAQGTAKVRLVLDNDELYPFNGKLLFSDTTVSVGSAPRSHSQSLTGDPGYNTFANVTIDGFTVSGRFAQWGQTAFSEADQQSFGVGASYRLRSWSIGIDWSRGNYDEQFLNIDTGDTSDVVAFTSSYALTSGVKINGLLEYSEDQPVQDRSVPGAFTVGIGTLINF